MVFSSGLQSFKMSLTHAVQTTRRGQTGPMSALLGRMTLTGCPTSFVKIAGTENYPFRPVLEIHFALTLKIIHIIRQFIIDHVFCQDK